jgi:hypothetical protein
MPATDVLDRRTLNRMLLVDGFYRANWRIEHDPTTATLTVDRFRRLPGDAADVVDEIAVRPPACSRSSRLRARSAASRSPRAAERAPTRPS